MSETETIDRLFLELSQFTTARTKRERELEQKLAATEADAKDMMLYKRNLAHVQQKLAWTEAVLQTEIEHARIQHELADEERSKRVSAEIERDKIRKERETSLLSDDFYRLNDHRNKLEQRLIVTEAACLAAYRAWVQPGGSSQFVKDEASHLLIDVVRPAAKKEQGMSDESEERIAWLRACLSDPDTMRFYTREQLLQYQAELDQLEAAQRAKEVRDE